MRKFTKLSPCVQENWYLHLRIFNFPMSYSFFFLGTSENQCYIIALLAPFQQLKFCCLVYKRNFSGPIGCFQMLIRLLSDLPYRGGYMYKCRVLLIFCVKDVGAWHTIDTAF